MPLDLSPESLAGWRQAQLMAGWFGSRVEAVYVQPWLTAATGLSAGFGIPEPYLSQDALDASVETLRHKLSPRRRSTSVRGGHRARHRVVGARRLRLRRDGHARPHGLQRAIKGSVAETIVARSPIPVLVLRRQMPKKRSSRP